MKRRGFLSLLGAAAAAPAVVEAAEPEKDPDSTLPPWPPEKPEWITRDVAIIADDCVPLTAVIRIDDHKTGSVRALIHPNTLARLGWS